MSCEITKAPMSVLDIGIVWTSWLNVGDTIATSVWEASDPAIIITQETNDTTSASCLIGGGVKGSQYTVTNRVTTADGLVDERYIIVYVNYLPAKC